MAYNSKYTGQEIEGLLDKVKSSKDKVFIGTEQEYNDAYANGLIPMGSLVIILSESEQLDDTIALLGKAIIGKMILGNS